MSVSPLVPTALAHTRSDDLLPYASGTFCIDFVAKLDETASDPAYSFLHETVTPSPAHVALDSAGGVGASDFLTLLANGGPCGG
jgi:hypothetical protein